MAAILTIGCRTLNRAPIEHCTKTLTFKVNYPMPKSLSVLVAILKIVVWTFISQILFNFSALSRLDFLLITLRKKHPQNV